MSRKLITKITVFCLVFVLITGIAQAGYMAYTTAVKNEGNAGDKPKTADNNKVPVKEDREAPRAISLNEMGEPKKPEKKEIDPSKVTLSKDMEDAIKKAKGKDADKHINNCKKLITKLNVPMEYTIEIKKLLDKGHDISDILAAYEFLYDNYGQISELEGLLDKKKSGKGFAQLFKEYAKDNKEFVPRNFEPGYLESLLKSPSMTADDIMIADRISQKGLKTFEELINLKRQGKSWKEIKSDLGIVNTEEKLPRIGVTSAQVRKHMEGSNLTEEQVVEALVLAGKFGKEDTEVIEKAKKGKKKEDILAEILETEYR
ncbi:MAG: hypothetical protein ACOYWZ_02685 [Bacillota bacterium]